MKRCPASEELGGREGGGLGRHVWGREGVGTYGARNQANANVGPGLRGIKAQSDKSVTLYIWKLRWRPTARGPRREVEVTVHKSATKARYKRSGAGENRRIGERASRIQERRTDGAEGRGPSETGRRRQEKTMRKSVRIGRGRRNWRRGAVMFWGRELEAGG